MIDAGTVASALDEVSATETPGAGAGPVRTTVPVVEVPPIVVISSGMPRIVV